MDLKLSRNSHFSCAWVFSPEELSGGKLDVECASLLALPSRGIKALMDNGLKVGFLIKEKEVV